MEREERKRGNRTEKKEARKRVSEEQGEATASDRVACDVVYVRTCVRERAYVLCLLAVSRNSRTRGVAFSANLRLSNFLRSMYARASAPLTRTHGRSIHMH